MTLTESALILLYLCVLAIKVCDYSTDVCSRFGFGDSAKGEWSLYYWLVVEIVLLAYIAKQQKLVRRLRYVKGDFVELPPVIEAEFAHLPSLQPSPCFHLFLSHAWPLGQDVCNLIKQRCREICPSLHVFLDVEDLVT
eukprot:3320787-Prymnesium_polylepis.1